MIEHNRCKIYVFQYYLQLKRTAGPQQPGSHAYLLFQNEPGLRIQIQMVPQSFEFLDPAGNGKIKFNNVFLWQLLDLFSSENTTVPFLPTWNDFKWFKIIPPNYFTSSFWSKIHCEPRNPDSSPLKIQIQISWKLGRIRNPGISIADPDANPDPDPSDPYVFGPPGSGSGSTSQEVWIRIRILLSSSKLVRKIFDSYLLFCDFFLTFYLW
jgi:hypothetical protein